MHGGAKDGVAAIIAFDYEDMRAAVVVQVPGPIKWPILGVSSTHFVERRYLFLEAEIVDNIFRQDVLKTMCR